MAKNKRQARSRSIQAALITPDQVSNLCSNETHLPLMSLATHDSFRTFGAKSNLLGVVQGCRPDKSGLTPGYSLSRLGRELDQALGVR